MNDVIYNLVSNDGNNSQYKFSYMNADMVLYTFGHYWTNNFTNKPVSVLSNNGNGISIELTSSKKNKKISLDYSEAVELFITLEHYYNDVTDELNKFKIQKFLEYPGG